MAVVVRTPTTKHIVQEESETQLPSNPKTIVVYTATIRLTRTEKCAAQNLGTVKAATHVPSCYSCSVLLCRYTLLSPPHTAVSYSPVCGCLRSNFTAAVTAKRFMYIYSSTLPLELLG